MAALARRSTPGSHKNVLQHLAGMLRGHASATARAEVREVIQRYAAGWIPLSVPVTLLRHHLAKVGSAWLAGQAYLEPYPPELGLRASV